MLGPPLFPAALFLIGCLVWGRSMARQWRLLAWYYGITVVLAPVSLALGLFSQPPVPLRVIAAACLLILWASSFVVAMYLYIGHRDQRALGRQHLCRKCGYDLTGNTFGRCPECGEWIPFRQRMTLYFGYRGANPYDRPN